MKRTTFAEFKKRALESPEVKAEYERLAPAYELRKKLVALRKTLCCFMVKPPSGI